MRYSAAKLNKLRGRSLEEVRDRSLQRLTILWDRFLGSKCGEPTDVELMEELVASPEVDRRLPGAIDDVLFETVQAMKARIAEGPAFSAMAERKTIAGIINSRWPQERLALLQSAERGVRERIRVFGLTDLSFGRPIDWRYEPVSGKQTPLKHWSQIDYLNPSAAGDKKTTWELNRHAHFVTLGQAYCLTGDDRYAEAFVNQANSWMDQNPPEMGINWTSALEVSLRAIAWTWAVHLLIDSPLLSVLFLKRLFKYLVCHARHIESYLSTYFSPNTHLTGEALGLFYLGVCFPEFRLAETWKQIGLRLLVEQLPVQVNADAVYFEQSSYYHRYTVDFYLHLLMLADDHGVEIPSDIPNLLAGLIDYLAWITQPEGRSTLVGDDDGGRLLGLGSRDSYDFRDSIGIGAAMFSRPAWKYIAGEQVPEILWLLGPAGLDRYDRLDAHEPLELDRAFESSGQYVVRGGWQRDSLYCFFRCGRPGALSGAHAHADQLSFELSSDGAVWLVDPGTYTYTLDPASRDLFRLTAGHNALTVDGLPQSKPQGPFSWSTRAKGSSDLIISERAFSYLSGEENSYEALTDPVRHRRAIALLRMPGNELIPPYLALTDYVHSNREHRYDIWYHFAPDVHVEIDGALFRAVRSNGASLSIAQFSTVEFSLQAMEGQVSQAYRNKESATIGRMITTAAGNQRFTAIIFPTPRDSQFVPLIRAAHGDPNAIEVRYAGHRDLLLFDRAMTKAGRRRVRSAGRLCWVRSGLAGLLGAGLVAGTELSVEGTFHLKSTGEIRSAYADLRLRRLKISADEGCRVELEIEDGIDQVEIAGDVIAIPGKGGRLRYGNCSWMYWSRPGSIAGAA